MANPEHLTYNPEHLAYLKHLSQVHLSFLKQSSVQELRKSVQELSKAWSTIGGDIEHGEYRPGFRLEKMSEQELSKVLSNVGDIEHHFQPNARTIPSTPIITIEWDLNYADLQEARLPGANLAKASLIGANLSGADLRMANLTGAVLWGANLTGANLSGADLSDTHLMQANLMSADLTFATLQRANLVRTDFTRAICKNASFEEATLVGANFEHADLTGMLIYGISAWDLNLTGALQRALTITPATAPSTITVDHLEVAQFIYLLLNNDRVREVIDTITSKVVLILGRFTPERKAVLDALREELRNRDYLPVVFDFEKPCNRDLTETVSTLAHMAKFVIADLTDATSVREELAVIVPQLPSVPVQPILLASEQEWAMFTHPARYPWVLPVVRYETTAELLANIAERVIGQAERELAAAMVKSNSQQNIKA